MITPEQSAMLALGVPVIGFVLVAMSGRVPNLRETFTLLTALVTFACVAGLYPAVMRGEEVRFALLEVMPGVPLSFRVEPLGMVYALVATLLWIPNSLYSIGYMRANHEKNQTRFYACYPLAIASAVGIAFADNIFTMFVFYETLTLSTFPLVTHKGTTDAMRSGRVYLGILLTTSVCFQLFAVLWIYVLSMGDAPAVESINFTVGGVFRDGLASNRIDPGIVGLLFFLYIYGIGKAALMPVHRWLPAAMVAPTPVSAFLHAVAVVKAGVFCVIKVTVYVFGVGTMQLYGLGNWLLYMAGATIIVASLIAAFQDNLKKRLAYSTISQLSYVVMATALLTPLSIMAATFHIVAHAFGKITLFFAAGSVYTAAHKTQVSQLDGIGRRMPATMAAFTIGALSMIGVPPAVGFISKWYLIRGVMERGELPGTHLDEIFVLVVIAASTLLNASYFLPIIYRAFFKPLSDEDQKHPHGEAPMPIVYALCFTAGLTLLFFFWNKPATDLAEMVRRAVS
ncbi:MAG: monovalent cation/H+ antiporter subunit D family protein [Planctomycetes bacterium]|nr:monovalent cation/H+ antiporter subunit D family protein [Planctomycetota bacterium]